jgi:ComF family protein
MGLLHHTANKVAALVQWAGDVIYPPRCPSCRTYVAADGNFCAECFSKLRMIDAPQCACCGIPFVVAVGADTRCPACLSNPPEFDVGRAALVYDAISAPLVTALKFHDQWAGLERYGQMMLRVGRPLLDGADVIIPVPLHWRRLLTRKFNQSALLAFALSAHSGVPCQPEWLRRVRYTRPQMHLDRATRLKNVARAFAVSEDASALLRDKIVVVVDDVVTTGATANACARVLKHAGAREVRVVALAQTVKE